MNNSLFKPDAILAREDEEWRRKKEREMTEKRKKVEDAAEARVKESRKRPFSVQTNWFQQAIADNREYRKTNKELRDEIIKLKQEKADADLYRLREERSDRRVEILEIRLYQLLHRDRPHHHNINDDDSGIDSDVDNGDEYYNEIFGYAENEV